jgi:hypothetical protein
MWGAQGLAAQGLSKDVFLKMFLKLDLSKNLTKFILS